MSAANYDLEQPRRSGSMLWFWIPLVSILVTGTAFSVVAFQQNELTILESIVAGFTGVGAVILGVITGIIGLIIGLIGALIGVIAAGGALAFTAFLIGSPIIAIVLFVLLMRRDKKCPDPEAHGDF